MKLEGLSFPDALKKLAARAGIEIDERTSRDDAHKARLREVLENAIAFYHVVLTQSKLGAPALEYLHARGFTDDTIEKFQLGWAPDGWDQTIQHAPESAQRHAAGAGGGRPDEPALQRARRLRQVPGPNHLPDPGRGRGRGGNRGADPAGSRGRKWRRGRGRKWRLGRRRLGAAGTAAPHAAQDGSAPKYLNSPATALFDKSRTLYLIERARDEMRRRDEAVLVEGYTDALMAHQAGFENVVASLGTALTPGPGRGHHPLRQEHRPRLRRRPGRPARGQHRRRGAVQADRRARGRGDGHRDNERARCPTARGQGSGRGDPGHSGSLAGSRAHRAADRGVPDRLLRHGLGRADREGQEPGRGRSRPAAARDPRPRRARLVPADAGPAHGRRRACAARSSPLAKFGRGIDSQASYGRPRPEDARVRTSDGAGSAPIVRHGQSFHRRRHHVVSGRDRHPGGAAGHHARREPGYCGCFSSSRSSRNESPTRFGPSDRLCRARPRANCSPR